MFHSSTTVPSYVFATICRTGAGPTGGCWSSLLNSLPRMARLQLRSTEQNIAPATVDMAQARGREGICLRGQPTGYDAHVPSAWPSLIATGFVSVITHIFVIFDPKAIPVMGLE